MAKKAPEIGMVTLQGCRCRCGHEWLPRDPEEKPRVCPKCKSPNWDRAKLYERKRPAHGRGKEARPKGDAGPGRQLPPITD